MGSTVRNPNAPISCVSTLPRATWSFWRKAPRVLYSNLYHQLPYLERWYHVAVAQQEEEFFGYVDGRKVFDSSGSVGNVASGGVSIGGWEMDNTCTARFRRFPFINIG